MRRPAAAVVVVFLAGCTGPASSIAAPEFSASGASWPEAASFFRGDPRMLGTDGAASVDLGDGRLLWLFGDTHIAWSRDSGWDRPYFISNMMALSDAGRFPQGTAKFFWRERPDPRLPAPETLGPVVGPHQIVDPILTSEGDLHYWPKHGIVVNGTLLLFAAKISYQPGTGLGFVPKGWTAFRAQPSGEPVNWTFENVPTSPRFGDGFTLGSGGVLLDSSHLVAFGTQSTKMSETETRHEGHVARWRLDTLGEAFDLRQPEWYDPATRRWVPEAMIDALPAALLSPGAPDYSVHHEPTLGFFVQIQSTGFGRTPVDVRVSRTLEGPWSASATAFTPPEGNTDGVFTYLALAHPGLTPGEITVSYSVNSMDENLHRQVYMPRFGRLDVEPGPSN